MPAKEKTVKCPDCDTEVKLIMDDDGDWNGRCPNEECRLDVGAAYDRARLMSASDRMRETREAARKESNKEKKNRLTF